MGACMTGRPAGKAHVHLQLAHEVVALLAHAARRLAVGDPALDAAAFLLRQVGRLRVPLVGDGAAHLLLLLALHHPTRLKSRRNVSSSACMCL